MLGPASQRGEADHGARQRVLALQGAPALVCAALPDLTKTAHDWIDNTYDTHQRGLIMVLDDLTGYLDEIGMY